MGNRRARRTTSFAGIPRIVIESEEFRKLSGNAVRLVLALAYQYRGKNNGDLTLSWSVMHEKFGFRSPGTLQRAREEACKAGLVMQTRTGYFQNPGHRCALYALTWLPIDECPGKDLEVKPTRLAPRRFGGGKD